MADIQTMLDKKAKLEQKIKEQKKREYEKFGKWFFNKYKINKSAEAKEFVNKYLKEYENNNTEFSSDNNNEEINVNDHNNFKKPNHTISE